MPTGTDKLLQSNMTNSLAAAARIQAGCCANYSYYSSDVPTAEPTAWSILSIRGRYAGATGMQVSISDLLGDAV